MIIQRKINFEVNNIINNELRKANLLSSDYLIVKWIGNDIGV